MNIRRIANFAPNYFEINREERQLAAIFYSALCLPGNASAFLRSIGVNHEIGADFGIYFEYAYLRDLWNNANDDVRKEIIRRKLSIRSIDALLNASLQKINESFGIRGKVASKTYLQSPAGWAISKFSDRFPDNDDFQKICRFKWCFNTKPDIVIHLDKETAVCIEAKDQSCEGKYPTSPVERGIFKKRGLVSVGQLKLQKYLMEDLLGVRTQFICLMKRKGKSDTHAVLSWSEAFSYIDVSSMPWFALEIIRRRISS